MIYQRYMEDIPRLKTEVFWWTFMGLYRRIMWPCLFCASFWRTWKEWKPNMLSCVELGRRSLLIAVIGLNWIQDYFARCLLDFKLNLGKYIHMQTEYNTYMQNLDFLCLCICMCAIGFTRSYFSKCPCVVSKWTTWQVNPIYDHLR